MAGELDENAVRDAGLALGFVDYKVCAVDEAWSGLKFARRKATAVETVGQIASSSRTRRVSGQDQDCECWSGLEFAPRRPAK
jgi:hypothetical protein